MSMSITRDVIKDLLPLYMAGEVSEDTRRLVEEFLQHDPELARVVRAAAHDRLSEETLPPLRKEIEMETVRRTKRLLRLRDAFYWIAVFLTPMPLAVYDTSWGSGWLIRDLPLVAATFALAAAGTWCAYFSLRRRLSATGL